MATGNIRFLWPLGYLLWGLLVWGQPDAETVSSTSITMSMGSWHIGQSHTDLIEIFGRQVPLPSGTWIVAGVGVDPTLGQPARADGVIATLVLFKVEAQTVIAFILIHANAIAIDGGWGISHDCQRTDLPFAKIYENSEQHAFCAFIRPLKTTSPPSDQDLAAWQDATNLARQHGWGLPTRWREAGFRICDWHDVLDIRYVFDTQTLITGPHQQSDMSELETTPEAILARWIDALLPRVYLGFKRSLAGQPIADMPGDANSSIQGKWTNQTAQDAMSNSVFSLWKIAINRIINIGTSIGIDYLFIGNIYLVAGLQVVSSTSHGVVDYAEELLWNTYGPQRLRKADSYDFTYIGLDDK